VGQRRVHHGASGQSIEKGGQFQRRITQHGKTRGALAEEDFLDRIKFAQNRFLQRAG